MRPCLVLCACLAAIIFTGHARAQMQELNAEQASIVLLSREAVRKELRLLPSQATALDSEAKRFGELVRQLTSSSRATTLQEQKQMQRQVRGAQAKFIATCLSLLQIEQRERLKQLGLQFYGPFAMIAPDISQAVGLTQAQIVKFGIEQASLRDLIESIQEKRAAQLRAIPMPKDQKDKVAVDAYRKKIRDMVAEFQNEDRDKMDQAKKASEKKLIEILTPSQRAKWEAMQGKKFAFRASE